MKKLYLVDVSSMFFRAYYAIPPLTTEAGLPTNALYGFLSMTIKLLRELKPDYMAYCFDRKGPSFRNELYADYKANRGEMPEDLVPQMPYIRSLTQVLGICDIDKEKYEADDVIGTLAKFGEKQGLEVIIVSGDKDFAQLVSPNVSIYDTMKNIKYDEQGVVDKWGIHPQQMIDYLSIVGDSSDNIPGVKGVGPKGAQKLLAEFGSLNGIYENIDKITAKAMKQKMVDYKDQALIAQRLVEIVTDIDLGLEISDLKLKNIDKDAVNVLLKELEFETFAKKITGETLEIKSSNVVSQFSKKKVSKDPAKPKEAGVVSNASISFKEQDWSREDLNSVMQPYSDVWFVQNERGVALACDGRVGQVHAELSEIKEILDGRMINWKGYDVKAFWRELQLEKPGQAKWDAMLAGYVIKPGKFKDYEGLFNYFTGEQTPDLANPSQILQTVARLEAGLQQKVIDCNGLSTLLEIDLPLVPVLYDMERAGVGLDSEELKKQSEILTKDIASLEKQIHELAGEPFNISSPKQLGTILFEKLGLPVVKKTKTGYSTNSEVLQKLGAQHSICDLVITYRELAKLKSTYVDALPQLINPITGRIHTDFRQALTTTGRLSSHHPNLQNIPIRTERGRAVRKAFVPVEGNVLLSVDYSQIELRVLAEITQDKGLMNAFENDQDIHVATASEVFGIPIERVTSDQRRMAKAVNFGIAYGQGPFGLAESLGIDRKEAKDIIENYFKKFKGVKDYMVSTVEQANSKGYVETLFGRRRYIDELSSSNGAIRKFGERAAINAPIQGTASDIVKKAMINIYNEVSIEMLLQVHDELLFSCPVQDVSEDAESVKEIMESSTSFKVPLRVNVAWGTNWEEAHA